MELRRAQDAQRGSDMSVAAQELPDGVAELGSARTTFRLGIRTSPMGSYMREYE